MRFCFYFRWFLSHLWCMSTFLVPKMCARKIKLRRMGGRRWVREEWSSRWQEGIKSWYEPQQNENAKEKKHDTSKRDKTRTSNSYFFRSLCSFFSFTIRFCLYHIWIILLNMCSNSFIRSLLVERINKIDKMLLKIDWFTCIQTSTNIRPV